jgi:hypothetical protein
MKLNVPVANSIEVCILDMYVNVNVRLTPLGELKSVAAKSAIKSLESELSGVIYSAIDNAMKKIEEVDKPC